MHGLLINKSYAMETQNQGASPSSNAPSGNKSPEQKSDNSTLMAVLSYIGPLVIIPYVTAKDNPFVKFHIKQGVVLFVIEVLLWVAGSIFIPLIMFIWIAQLGVLALAIMGIINAVQKKEKEIPLVGSFSKHINI